MGMISSSKFSMRYMKTGYVFTNAGLASIADNHDDNIFVLSLMNSSVADYVLKFLAPTLNYSNGDLGRMPILLPPQMHLPIGFAVKCLDISKLDWDSFETSWDFKRHPLV